MFNLKDSVKERFTELKAAVPHAEIERHCKVIAFRDSIRKSLQQGKNHYSCRWKDDSLPIRFFRFSLGQFSPISLSSLLYQSNRVVCAKVRDKWCRSASSFGAAAYALSQGSVIPLKITCYLPSFVCIRLLIIGLYPCNWLSLDLPVSFILSCHIFSTVQSTGFISWP